MKKIFDKPILSEDNTLTYENVFNDADKIIYTPVSTGVKEEIVLEKYTDNNIFEFVVEFGNLDPAFDLNAQSSYPTETQIVSLQRLIAWLNYQYEVDSVKKHKDLDNQTKCPGQYAEEALANRYVFW